MKAYVVIENSAYVHDEGENWSIVGLFSTKDKAIEEANNQLNHYGGGKNGEVFVDANDFGIEANESVMDYTVFFIQEHELK